MHISRAVILVCLLSSFRLYGCGLDWSLPYGRFPHVNEFGEISFWEKIDEIKIGENLTIPLNVNFNSNRKTSSIALGKGWIFGLLDTCVYAIDENQFIQYDPSGRFRNFWRDSTHENIIANPDGWKGEIDGDTIKLYADCGWKFVYTSGKISNITTPQGQVINYQFTVNGVQLYNDGKVILEVESGVDNHSKVIKYGETSLRITLGDRPGVKYTENAGYTLSDISKSVMLVKGPHYEREFFYDVTNEILPRFTVDPNSDDPLKLTWDPARKNQIVDDGIWRYSITSNEFPRQASAIERHSSDGATEFVKFDPSQQTETFKTADGFKIIRQEINLKSAESYRAVTRELLNPQFQVVQRNSFREDGVLYRTVKKVNGEIESVAEFDRTDSGELVEIIVDGKTIWKK